jgi:methyl-accepting chemotaxis protein
MNISLRKILISLFLVFSLALAGLTGNLAISSFRDYRTYSQVALLASLDKSMFEALVNLRAERGNSAIALIMSKSMGTASKNNVEAARTVIDAAMSQFAAQTSLVDDADITPALKEAIDAFNKLKALRSRVDSNLALDLDQRVAGLNQEVLDVGNTILTTFEDTSTLLEGRIRTLDQGLTALIQMRAHAWAVRNNGGVSAVAVSSILSANRAFTAEERATLLSSDAATKFAWKAVGALVAHPSASATLKSKFAAGQSAYFEGAFATRRAQMITELASGPTKVFTVDDWQATSNAALGVVAQVASAAMSELDTTAAEMKSNAAWNAVVMSGGLLLTIAVGFGGTMIVIRRVIRPIGQLAECMVALSAGNLTVVVPSAGRGDEIGEMARSVEIFREAAVRNRQLEQEAEANRAQAEADRIELQRAAEEDADRRLRQATASLAKGLQALSSGDMMCEITEPFAPQFEALRHDFNSSVHQLRVTLSEFGRSVSTVNSGANEVSSASNELARRTEQQAASLEETAAALEEVTANVKATSQRASDARETVRQAKIKADHSSAIVQDAMAAMERIEGSSKQIGQIIGVIDEIAFQTNLLALNAGVEAARAGEAGKGFAVVAQEVRELAQRSATAAREIKQLIESSALAVNEGVKLVDNTGTGLGDIETLVRMANEHMEAVATAAQEQSAGLSQINTAVNHMDQATQQNAAMVEEMNAAGANLAQECIMLDNQLSKFSFGAQTDELHSLAAKMRPAPMRARA